MGRRCFDVDRGRCGDVHRLLFRQARLSGKNILDILVTLPLVLPPTVTGYYLFAPGPKGLLGGPLYDLTGWSVTFTWWAAIVASTVVSLPFMVRTGRAAIESVDRNVEYASQLLGKSEWSTALTITLPLARHGLIAGLILAFARAMGEFGATLMLAGNIPGGPIRCRSRFTGPSRGATWGRPTGWFWATRAYLFWPFIWPPGGAANG